MTPERGVSGERDRVDAIARDVEEALGGQIRVTGRLGKGRAGIVYLAEQPALGRKITVKVLKPRRVQDPKAVSRFKREARAMAACPHPGIVPVHTVGATSSGLPFFTMEYIDGDSLAERLAARGKLSLQETVRIVGAVGDALTYAHERGLVHRDVKPANILLENTTGRVLITDFGLAKVTSSDHSMSTLTGAGEILGEPAYLSPEQAESGQVDARSDQYSLAVVAYEMLTGSLPFSGPGPRDYVRQHAEETPTWILKLEPELPAEIARVIDRGLMKEPGARYASAEAFGQALRSAATAAPATTAARSGPDWARRGRHLLQAAALYAGAAWGALELFSWVLETFSLPMEFRQPALWIAVAGLPVVLMVVWLHERAVQDR